VLIPPDFNLYYSDPGELESLIPLKDELEKRSLVVRVTKDLSLKSDIGIYAVGANHLWDFENGGFIQPRNRFSVIMLHDLAQDNGAGAEFFLPNEWSNFDLGVLPNYSWLHNFNLACAVGVGSGPRFGCHVTGYPKFDKMSRGSDEKTLNDILRSKSDNFSTSKPNLLLASSWISAQHVRDVLNQVSDEQYNILLKVPNYESDFSELDNSPWRDVLIETRLESFRILEEFSSEFRVSIVKPETSIFDVLRHTNVVISNGSNVIHEGLLMGIPAISVENWLHPSGPSGNQFSSVRMDLPGCIDCESHGMRDALNLALSSTNMASVVMASEQLLSNEFRGNSSRITLNLVNQIYTQATSVKNVPERDSAVAERDSVLNSGIWKATKPYRWLRSKF